MLGFSPFRGTIRVYRIQSFPGYSSSLRAQTFISTILVYRLQSFRGTILFHRLGIPSRGTLLVYMLQFYWGVPFCSLQAPVHAKHHSSLYKLNSFQGTLLVYRLQFYWGVPF